MDPLTSLKSPAREHGGGGPRAAAAELLGVWLAAGMARESIVRVVYLAAGPRSASLELVRVKEMERRILFEHV